MAGPPLRVGLISLGCAKNLVDAELMLGGLLSEGIEVTNDPKGADALIVNTCSFITSAQEESLDAILETAAAREAENPGQALIVAGCLPQRFREELPRLLPEVDAFMGVDQLREAAPLVRAAVARRAERRAQAQRTFRGRAGRPEVDPPLAADPAGAAPAPPPLVAVARRPTYIPDYATSRFRLTPRHLAYVKIAEGCNHPCSFCAIPRMRGRHRSRPQGDLLEEARRLLAEGVKELNLISQDSTYYGRDLRSSPPPVSAPALPAERTTLCTLLRALNELPGDFWVRLLYTHPAHWTDELIATLAECPKVPRYVDMPLQHIHDEVLTRMRRETSGAYIEDLLGRIRTGVPGLTLRTTFIVGFPGETEARFAALVEFIRRIRFERLGVFTYSREDGTVAGRMSHQVPEKVKQRRREIVMAAQREIAREIGAARVGREIRVLVERQARARELSAVPVRSWEHGLVRGIEEHPLAVKGPVWVARSEADAPDIDGRVYVRGRVQAGEFARVRVMGHTDYDLLATAT